MGERWTEVLDPSRLKTFWTKTNWVRAAARAVVKVLGLVAATAAAVA